MASKACNFSPEKIAGNLTLTDGTEYLNCDLLPIDYCAPGMTTVSVWVDNSILIVPLNRVKQLSIFEKDE
jgi:hypothetical protein